MSAAASLDFAYQYPFASNLATTGNGAALQLATCGGAERHPHFFEGTLLHPRAIGDMLLVLSDVVRTHFFLPRPAMLDPVVTSSESVLRFEGFSGCCGVYVRADLPAASFDADLLGRGTTNVDFNNPMRSALIRLQETETARLSVGQDAVTLSRDAGQVVEKKVKLPIRWVKGFSEVQAYQPALELKMEVAAGEARRLIRSLPRSGGPKRPSFVTLTGRSLRLSQRESKGSVRLLGTHRLRVLEPLLAESTGMRIWADDARGTSGWEVQTRAGTLFLMLSPEVYRGFSGEGQVLEQLAVGRWEQALPAVRAQMNWQSQIDPGALSRKTGFSTDEVRAALAVLGARGMAGYDASAGAFFHRELPFDLDQIEMLQPRLINARKLLEASKVKLISQGAENQFDLAVAGTGVEHFVRLRPDQDKCTCPWFSKHRGERGPCKHILASRMLVDADDDNE